MSKKILFFIEGLECGGKERRLLELVHFLRQNTDFELKIVVTEFYIHYNYANNLGIPIIFLKRRLFKKDPFMIFRFYKVAREFSPNLIHTWGGMTTFYSIPTKLILKRPLVSSLISNAKKKYKNWSFLNFILKINCLFSDKIISNSEAGVKAYKIDNYAKKIIIINNGVHLNRFILNIDNNKIRSDLQVNTKYMIIMVASFTDNKDYDLFLDIASFIKNIRDDVTFVGVGNGPDFKKMQNRIIDENLSNIILTGERNDVEELIAVSDIGVLLTNNTLHAEGISNSIIEYMALGKPVITTDITGGSREIIVNQETGFIMNRDTNSIAKKINQLLNDDNMRKTIGERAKQIIETKFTIKRMGDEYLKIYNSYNQS